MPKFAEPLDFAIENILRENPNPDAAAIQAPAVGDFPKYVELCSQASQLIPPHLPAGPEPTTRLSCRWFPGFTTSRCSCLPRFAKKAAHPRGIEMASSYWPRLQAVLARVITMAAP